jgi:hypothetical protein
MAKILAGGIDGWRQIDELPFDELMLPLKLRRDGRYASTQHVPVHPGSDFGRNQRVAVEVGVDEARPRGDWPAGVYASSLVMADLMKRLEEIRRPR